MKRIVFASAGLLVVLVLVVGAFRMIQDAQAQSSNPPRIFQTEIRLWAGDGADTSGWQFTYLADGTLHAVTTLEDGSCASLSVPEGVFVSFIGSDGVTSSQPGNGEALTVCEAFFTRANG